VSLTETLIEAGQIVGAFVITMVWGHGNSGYGPFRTRQVLTGLQNPQGFGLDTTSSSGWPSRCMSRARTGRWRASGT
jgi:hypothetical protein